VLEELQELGDEDVEGPVERVRVQHLRAKRKNEKETDEQNETISTTMYLWENIPSQENVPGRKRLKPNGRPRPRIFFIYVLIPPDVNFHSAVRC
jgi:hypothetical protein